MTLTQLDTPRLHLRQLTKEDFQALLPILGDGETMYAWEAGFSAEETAEYIQKNLARYREDGYSFLAVILRETEELIGLCGPLTETIEGKKHLGLGYIFHKSHWGKGYAFEAASVCLNYCFHTLNANEVIADIRPNNISSLKLAKKLGMTQVGEFVKHYKGKAMPHLVFRIIREEFEQTHK